jgi:hypothetical protein
VYHVLCLEFYRLGLEMGAIDFDDQGGGELPERQVYDKGAVVLALSKKDRFVASPQVNSDLGATHWLALRVEQPA